MSHKSDTVRCNYCQTETDEWITAFGTLLCDEECKKDMLAELKAAHDD